MSACAYHPRWQGNMRLLDDVRLIESVILTPPTDCTDVQMSRCEPIFKLQGCDKLVKLLVARL